MCQIQKMTHLILTNFCCFSVHARDAAVVIANYISKDERSFVKLMNKKANELGMTNTTFSNCHGLDDDTKNFSTARDMAILSSYAYKLDIYKLGRDRSILSKNLTAQLNLSSSQ